MKMSVLELVGADDGGKALQLYIDGDPLLVIGNVSRMHSDILTIILKRHEIPFQPIQLDEWGREFGPPPLGDRYELVGAGYAHILPNEITLLLNSDGYNMGIHEGHAKEIGDLLQDKLN